MRYVSYIFLRESGLTIISLLLLLFQSCRDDIIDPNNSNGNVNEPIVSTDFNSFSFQINAVNITHYIVKTIDFSSTENQITINVANYKKGKVPVFVINKNNSRNLFPADFSNTHLYNNQLVTGDFPYKVIIAFSNFSGFFKLNLYAVQPH